MNQMRKADSRGKTNMGWLNSAHTFSFGHYHDSRHMGFGDLRVINDDRVTPGAGFGTHGHRDMEIISYVLEGSMDHKDSMGNGSTIRPGDVQRMSAGTGVMHSEFNHSKKDPLRFLQIWVMPDRRGHEPGYDQKHFPVEEREGKLRLVLSEDGREDTVTLNQDFNMYTGLFDGNQSATFEQKPGRQTWVQVARGSIRVGEEKLQEGDGLAVTEPGELTFHDGDQAEVILFDTKQ